MNSKKKIQHPKTMSLFDIEKLHMFAELNYMRMSVDNYIANLLSQNDVASACQLYGYILDIVIKHENGEEIEEVSSVD